MKKLSLIVIFFSVLSGVHAAIDTSVQYSVEQIIGNRWQYTYEVQNISFAPGIEQFTIWFDLGKFENLAVESVGISSNWIESLWQPEPLLLDHGGYDAKALTTPITIGESLFGFSVSFDWVGMGTPASQYYEIINPNTLDTLDSGYTQIPEPLSLMLMVIGARFLKKNRPKT